MTHFDTPKGYTHESLNSRKEHTTQTRVDNLIALYGQLTKNLHIHIEHVKYSILIPMRRRLQQEQVRQKLIIYAILGMIGLVVVGFIVVFGMFLWYGRDLPSPTKLSQNNDNSTIFYDRNGKVLYELYKDKNRVPVALKDISKYLQEGTIAIEDKNFYKENKGISEWGILRSFVLGRGGGSTITQQLVKNVLIGSEHSYVRKIKEAILATEVSRKYSKDQILEMYLNAVPYGGSYWGVETASQGYFGKDPKDLTLVESAILAGLPQQPSYYSPFVGKNQAWKYRAMDVLRRMREDGDITKQQESDADKQLDSVKFQSPKEYITAPHFVFHTKQELEDQYGAKMLDQGLQIKTTIDLDVQKKVEQIVHDEIAKLKDYNVTNGAAVVLDSQTGEILAYVGSHDYNDEKNGQFDVVSQGLRQPGSTLKPLEYAVAFEKGYTPATTLMDVKTSFASPGQPDYIPQNYDLKFRGPIQIRFALGNSLNVPAVKMMAMIGLQDFLQKAEDMGMPELAPTDQNLRNLGLSASLGGGATTLLHLATAYTVFAHGGIKTDVESVKEIKDFKGKTIFEASKPKQKQVLEPEVAFLISHILSDDNARSAEFGPHSYLEIGGKTVAVKTGTTDDKRDNYAVGFTKSITVAVWVGNNDNSPMNPKIASGITGASPIWHDIMTALLKKYPDGIMDKPDKVKALEIDAYLGGLPKDGYPKRSEYFIDGTEPKDVSPFYKKLKISKSTGKLANDVEIKTGNYDEKDYIVFEEKDPVSTDGKNRWQEGIDAWVKDQPDEKYHPPTDVSDASADDVIVSIKSPGDKSTVNGSKVEIQSKVTTGPSVKNVKIYVNGSETKSIDGNNKDIDESIDLSDGDYEIKVGADNEKGKHGDATIHIGVNKPWDANLTPTQTPTPTPTPGH